MAWSSVTGIDQRGRWRLRDRPGRRHPRHLPLRLRRRRGRHLGLIAERVAARMMRGNFKGSLRNVKRALEANGAGSRA